MDKDVNLNLLKYFFEIINEKNITKASKNLFISQPALTKAIQQLETQLNAKLIERKKTGIVPTLEGEILYNYIKNTFQELNSILNTIEISKFIGGNLYIGSTTTNFLEPLKPALILFKNLYPNIHIDIVLEEINILEERAKMGKLDIVIKNDYESVKNFELIKSFDIQDEFFASRKNFEFLENEVLNLKQILEYPFILLSKNTHGRKNFDSYLQSKKIDFKPTYEFNSYSLCHELIKNGFGIGIGNPIHYPLEEFILIKTNFNLPKRTFDIGYIKTSKNNLLEEFINLI